MLYLVIGTMYLSFGMAYLIYDITHRFQEWIALSFLDVVFVTLDDVFGTWNVYLIFGTVVFCIWR